MVIDRGKGTWEHRVFADLPDLLDPRDVLVRNDTRVVPARLVGHREATGGRWEGLFLRELPDGAWEVMSRTRGRPAIGERVVVGQGLRLALEARGESGCWIVRPLSGPGPEAEDAWPCWNATAGRPCPRTSAAAGRRPATGRPIRRSTPAGRARPPRRRPACTSPTDVLDRLAGRGIACVNLTLHVGPGTFRPITAERLEDHVMHAEWAELSGRGRRRAGGASRAGGSDRGRRHDLGADPGDGGDRRDLAAVRRRDPAVHPARARLPRAGCADHQLPPAAQQPAGAGRRLGRRRTSSATPTPRPSAAATGSSATAMRC